MLLQQDRRAEVEVVFVEMPVGLPQRTRGPLLEYLGQLAPGGARCSGCQPGIASRKLGQRTTRAVEQLRMENAWLPSQTGQQFAGGVRVGVLDGGHGVGGRDTGDAERPLHQRFPAPLVFVPAEQGHAGHQHCRRHETNEQAQTQHQGPVVHLAVHARACLFRFHRAL